MKRFPISFALSGGNEIVDRIIMVNLLFMFFGALVSERLNKSYIDGNPAVSTRGRVLGETRGFPAQSHDWCGFTLCGMRKQRWIRCADASDQEGTYDLECDMMKIVLQPSLKPI